MTVLENLMISQHNYLMRASGYTLAGIFGLRGYKNAEKAAIEKSKYWLDKVALTDRADDPVIDFSRGMRQRLALERALLHNPTLVLMDEPFTGLDDHATGIVSERLRRLAAGGCIVCMATHDLDLADGLVTRVALVRNGRLLSDERADPGLRARYRELVRSGT